jgi:hypothetical protein
MEPLASPAVRLVIAPPAPEEALAMLSAWSWLLPERVRAVGINRFGDWYLATPDGAIHLLSIWEGTLAPVASSFDAWREWVATEDGMETNWSELVLLLHDRGQFLADGQCFAFEPPLIGDIGIDVDGIMVTALGAITATMGQTFRQLASTS